MPPEKSFIADPWRNLRRSGAWVAVTATVISAGPLAYSIYRNATGHGDHALLVWTIGIALALAGSCVLAWRIWRTDDHTTQWQLTALCWITVIGVVASTGIVNGSGR
ncbi:hypothetical protein [Dactylosporangium darangshiense]|uniref:Integral membrane protein n=1 Tax=Dactylosporangium darangshiense TaxID=579108 RepID=A0ABP8DMK6_9ACTN